MSTYDLLNDIQRQDKYQPDVIRFGKWCPLLLRDLGDGWGVEDTRLWDPYVASFPDKADAIQFAANMFDAERMGE